MTCLSLNTPIEMPWLTDHAIDSIHALKLRAIYGASEIGCYPDTSSNIDYASVAETSEIVF